MADMRNVVVCIEVLPPLVIEQILHLPAYDIQRLLIRDAQISPKQPPSRLQNISYPCHLLKSACNRGKFSSIAGWLICKYSFSGRCCC
jgi:hypothetical protein